MNTMDPISSDMSTKLVFLTPLSVINIFFFFFLLRAVVDEPARSVQVLDGVVPVLVPVLTAATKS